MHQRKVWNAKAEFAACLYFKRYFLFTLRYLHSSAFPKDAWYIWLNTENKWSLNINIHYIQALTSIYHKSPDRNMTFESVSSVCVCACVKLCNSSYRWPPCPLWLHPVGCRTASGKWQEEREGERRGRRVKSRWVRSSWREREKERKGKPWYLVEERMGWSDMRGERGEEVQTGWRWEFKWEEVLQKRRGYERLISSTREMCGRYLYTNRSCGRTIWK